MDIAAFRKTLTDGESPEDNAALLALWHDGRGDWHAAHESIQNDNSATGARVHAYLHRKEGDVGNAAYWYRRAGQPPASGSLADEWGHIASTLLATP